MSSNGNGEFFGSFGEALGELQPNWTRASQRWKPPCVPPRLSIVTGARPTDCYTPDWLVP
jgi:hypothetical protein